MSTEENKALVRRYFEERWNHNNVAVCDELLAPSFDIAGHKAWMQSMHDTFAHLRLTLLDVLAEGDQVAVHWRISGTHQGDYVGVPATGKRVTMQGMALLRITDGKIVEDQAYTDNLELQQELSSTLTPDEAANAI